MKIWVPSQIYMLRLLQYLVTCKVHYIILWAILKFCVLSNQIHRLFCESSVASKIHFIILYNSTLKPHWLYLQKCFLYIEDKHSSFFSRRSLLTLIYSWSISWETICSWKFLRSWTSVLIRKKKISKLFFFKALGNI